MYPLHGSDSICHASGVNGWIPIGNIGILENSVDEKILMSK